jgi:glycosyltransferase involved in cell wall biosynthesis
VVVEGYNEVQLATSVTDVLDWLARQDYPLERVELVLVGNEAQYRDWREMAESEARFHRVVVVEAEGALYYELKNKGAARASGEIIAFVDSDVRPHPNWLSAIVRSVAEGADVTAGVSTFWNRTRLRIPRALLDVASSVSFGHVVGADSGSGALVAGGIVAHNFGARAETFRSINFRTDPLGRNCGAAFLYHDLREAGARIELVPGQRADHSFSPKWFLYPFHIRVGWEEYALRRVGPNPPSRWTRRAGPFEPLVAMPWYVCLDLRAWLRYSKALGLGAPRRWGRWPLILIPSIAARIAGMVGAYAAMLRPARARAWAEAQ